MAEAMSGANDRSAARPPAGIARLEATVHGVVQGVGFRWFVVREAQALELSGWVANDPDGSVRVVAEGPPSDLARLLVLLEEGPAGAWVERVVPVWMPAVGLPPGFGIRSRAHLGD